MRKNTYFHHDEDDFFHAIKDTNEIEMDMKQRENQNDPTENSKENHPNSQENEYQENDNNENEINEQDENNKTDEHLRVLGDDFISLF